MKNVLLFCSVILSLGSTMGNGSPSSQASQQLRLSGKRIGVLRDDGAALVKEGGLSAGWTTELTGVRQLVLSGNRIGVLTNDGVAMVKEGGLSAGWTTEVTDVRQLVLSGNRIGVLTNDGVAMVKEGGLSAAWITESAGVRQLVLSGNRIGVLTNDGVAMVKEGGLSAAWITEATEVDQVVLDGNRIGVLTNDSVARVKEGGLSAAWTNQITEVRLIALSGDRIGVLTNDGIARVKEGPLNAGWITEYSDVHHLAMSDDRIGVLTNDGSALVKEGGLSTAWVRQELQVESEIPSSESKPEPSDETDQSPDISADSSPGPDTSADLLLEGTDLSPDADQGPDTTTDSSPDADHGPDTTTDSSLETDQGPDTITDSSLETDQGPDTITEPSQAAESSSASGAAKTSAAPVPRRSDGYKTLILLHGFNKDGSVNCDKYWGDGKVEKYLNNKRGWAGRVKKLTYYWSGGKGCTRIPESGGTGHAIEDLGSAFAWYIYNTYSRHGVAVDVIAHSMGGLVTRTAITGTQKRWRTASGRNFPPFLYIEDVATLSSPHEGARGRYGVACSKSKFQVCQMIPDSFFLRSWIAPYGNPQSKMGTDWSLISSGTDWVVTSGSGLNTKAVRHPGHKYLFMSGSGLDHDQIKNINGETDGRRWGYPIRYCHYNASCNMAKPGDDGKWWIKYSNGAGPLWVAANAVFSSSW